MSGDARGLPSDKLVVDSGPGAKRVSSKFDFVVDGFLKELPSNVSFALVGGKEFLEGLVPVDSEEVAPGLVPNNVLGKRVVVPGIPKVP